MGLYDRDWYREAYQEKERKYGSDFSGKAKTEKKQPKTEPRPKAEQQKKTEPQQKTAKQPEPHRVIFEKNIFT